MDQFSEDAVPRRGSEEMPTDLIIKERVRRYLSEGKFKEAEEYYIKSLTFRETAYGKTHPSLVPLLEDIVSFFHRILEPDKAQVYEDRLNNLKTVLDKGEETHEEDQVPQEEDAISSETTEEIVATEEPELETEEDQQEDLVVESEAIADEPIDGEIPSFLTKKDESAEAEETEITPPPEEEVAEEPVEEPEMAVEEEQPESESAIPEEVSPAKEEELPEEQAGEEPIFGMAGLAYTSKSFRRPDTSVFAGHDDSVKAEEQQPAEDKPEPFLQEDVAEPESVQDSASVSAEGPQQEESIPEEESLTEETVEEPPVEEETAAEIPEESLEAAEEEKQEETIPEATFPEPVKAATEASAGDQKTTEKESMMGVLEGIHLIPVKSRDFDLSEIRNRLQFSDEEMARRLSLDLETYTAYESQELPVPSYLREQCRILEKRGRLAPYRLGQIARLFDIDGVVHASVAAWSKHPQLMLDQFTHLKPPTNSATDRKMIQFMAEVSEYISEISGSEDSTAHLTPQYQSLFWSGYYSYQAAKADEDIDDRTLKIWSGEEIADLRSILGLTLDAFAAKLGIAPDNYLSYEKGERIAPEFIQELFTAFSEERKHSVVYYGQIARLLDNDGSVDDEIPDWVNHPKNLLDRLGELKPKTNGNRDRKLLELFETIPEFITAIQQYDDYPAVLPQQQQVLFWIGYYDQQIVAVQDDE